jgi:hypothetical protein
MTDQTSTGIKLTVALNRAARIVAGIADPRERVTVTLTQEHVAALSTGAREILSQVLATGTYMRASSSGAGVVDRPLPPLAEDTADAVCAALEATAVEVRDAQAAYDARMIAEAARQAEWNAEQERLRAERERKVREAVALLDPATMTPHQAFILSLDRPRISDVGGNDVPADLVDHVRAIAKAAQDRHAAEAAEVAIAKAARTQAAYDLIGLSDEARLVVDGGLDATDAVRVAMRDAGLNRLRSMGLSIQHDAISFGLRGVRAKDLTLDQSLALLSAAQVLHLPDEAWPVDDRKQLMARDVEIGEGFAAQLDVWRAEDIRDDDGRCDVADEDLPAMRIVITVRVRHIDLDCGWSDCHRVL